MAFGVRIGSRLNPRISTGFGASAEPFANGITITKDGPQHILMPASLAEWNAATLVLDNGAGLLAPPQFDFPFQEASGACVDVMNGNSWPASTAPPSYQQAFLNWLAKCLTSTDPTAVQGLIAAAGTLWSITTQEVVIYLHFGLTTSTGLRELIGISGSTYRIATTNGTGKLEIVPGALIGTVDYRDSLLHPLLIEIVPGTGVINFSGAGLWRISTDKEQITGTWSSTLGNDTKGLFGAIAGQTAPTVQCNKLEAYTGSNGAYLSGTIGPKNFLTRRGWAVTGY